MVGCHYLLPFPRNVLSSLSGDPLIAYAEDEAGVSGLAAPLVVWLLAFSLAGIWNICYASYLLWINGTWGRYKWEGGGDLCRKWCKVSEGWSSVYFGVEGKAHFASTHEVYYMHPAPGLPRLPPI